MADFFAPKRPSGRVAPEPGLGSIPENKDATATLPRQTADDQLQSKEHVAEAVDTFIKAKSFRPALARAVASAARNVPALRDDVYDHVLTALRRQPARGWPLLCVVALTCPPATETRKTFEVGAAWKPSMSEDHVRLRGSSSRSKSERTCRAV